MPEDVLLAVPSDRTTLKYNKRHVGLRTTARIRASFSGHQSPFIDSGRVLFPSLGVGLASLVVVAGQERTTNLLFHKKRLAVLVSSAAMANITREEGGRKENRAAGGRWMEL